MTNCRLLTASLLAASALTFAAPAQAQRVDRIVAFGDSYADDGNFFQLVGLVPFPQPYSTGRFSGGTNYIDTLGTLLDVPIDNFAIGGALTDNTNTNGPPLGFVTEWNAFLAGGGGAFPTVSGTFDKNDLLAISIGGNDARYFQNTLGGTVATAPAAANASAAFATAGLNALVDAGARNISFLAGNTAILPEIAGNASAQAIRDAYSTTFNAAMQTTLSGYAANGVMVHYLDLTLVGQQITNDLAAYGLTGYACPALPDTSCIINPNQKYLFYYDQLHLTSAGFAIVGQYIATQLEAPLTLQAASDLGLDVARQFGRTLTSRMDTGSPRDGDTLDGLKFFVAGDGYNRKLNAGQTVEAYRSSGVGVSAGAEYGFGSGVAGVALNYSRPKINFGNDAAENEARSIQVGGYAGFGIAGAFAQGYAGYGWDKHDIDRAGVVEDMEADPKGHHLVAGAKGGYLMPMGGVRIGPIVALDYAKAKVDGYTESGDPALTLNVDSVTAKSLTGGIGAEVRGDFDTGGASVRPYFSAMLEKELSDNDRVVRFAQTSAPGIVNNWALGDRSKRAYGRISGGGSAEILSSVTLNAVVSSTVGRKDGNDVSAQVGLNLGL